MVRKHPWQEVPKSNERKNTDAAIYQLASIVESSGDAILSKTLEGVITSWNSSAEKLFGYTADEVIGKSIALIIPPDRPGELSEILAKIRAEETIERYETVRVSKDGTRIDVSINVSPIRDVEGRIIGVSAIAHDITEQKRLIEELATRNRELEDMVEELAARSYELVGSNKELATRSSELHKVEDSNEELATRTHELEDSNEELATQTHELERTRGRLRAIIDAAQEAMLFLASDGSPIEVNTRFTDFFGLDSKTVLELSADQLTAFLNGQFVDAILLARSLARDSADQGHIFREQQRQVEPSRKKFDLYSLPVIAVDQTDIGRLYVWHDATQEREVDRLKSEFVALVSHELRTPLTSIKGYVDLLLTDETFGELSELQREFLGITQNNARRLVSLINDLLDLTHMESGKIELQRKPLDINLLIRELMPSLQPNLDARRQTLTLHLPEETPIALGDANRVTQILTNLLSNAHKYTLKGGHIDLSVEIVGPFVRVAITDSGVGLSTEEQAKLFNRFYRAQNPLTEAVGGTGLGLVITKSLVEMQGGEIQVSSAPGQGSTFCFTLPLAEYGRLSASPREALLGKRILLVDDELDIRHLLQRYLEGAGYEVIMASMGVGAFQLVKTGRPDLIILDMELPDSSGLTVLEWLKSDATTASIPVILLTVVNDDGQGRLLGAADYLDKPINMPDLLQRIDAIFARQASAPDSAPRPS